jgi:hypothetical protein
MNVRADECRRRAAECAEKAWPRVRIGKAISCARTKDVVNAIIARMNADAKASR